MLVHSLECFADSFAGLEAKKRRLDWTGLVGSLGYGEIDSIMGFFVEGNLILDWGEFLRGIGDLL